MLRDEMCRMICDHNGGREFLFSRNSIQAHTDVTKAGLTLNLHVGLLQTPAHFLSWRCTPGVGEVYSPTAPRSSWLSPVLKMSLKPLTNRGSGAFGKYDRLTEF